MRAIMTSLLILSVNLINLSAFPHHGHKNPEDSKELLGKWKVIYNDESFKGEVVYEVKLEGERVKGYAISYKDESGKTTEMEELVLQLKSYKKGKGKGTYSADYEGTRYDMNCTLKLVSPRELTVSYSYYGYSGTEQWIRMND